MIQVRRGSLKRSLKQLQRSLLGLIPELPCERLKDVYEDWCCRRSWHPYHLAGSYERIYIYHVRKAAGTSLCHMIFGLGGEDGKRVYEKVLETPRRQLRSGDKVFVRWNKRIIERGDYYAAVSHIPAHQLRLPPRTFTLVCLRDPAERVLSHYRMRLEFEINDVSHPCMDMEGAWLGKGFDDFLSNIDRGHLLNQIYMFSAAFDVDEAFERIIGCSHIMFTERFEEGVAALCSKLGVELKPVHSRRTSLGFSPTSQEEERLQTMLAPEYELYDRLMTHYDSTRSAGWS